MTSLHPMYSREQNELSVGSVAEKTRLDPEFYTKYYVLFFLKVGSKLGFSRTSDSLSIAL